MKGWSYAIGQFVDFNESDYVQTNETMSRYRKKLKETLDSTSRWEEYWDENGFLVGTLSLPVSKIVLELILKFDSSRINGIPWYKQRNTTVDSKGRSYSTEYINRPEIDSYFRRNLLNLGFETEGVYVNS